MTRLPELERLLVDAAERLDASTHAGVDAVPDDRHETDAANASTLRARWRRMGHRGHVASVLAGAFVFGAVATGSAQVAGLDPFAYLSRFERHDSRLAPSGKPGESVVVASPAGAERAWQARAYVSRNGDVCLTAGRARTSPTSGGSSLGCWHSDELAATIERPGTGGVVSSFAVVKGSQNRPRRLVAYAIASDRAPAVTFAVDRRTTAKGQPSVDRLHVPVDRSPDGLSAAGRKRVAELPETLSLRLHAVEVPAPRQTRPSADVFLPERTQTAPDGTVQVRVTTYTTWSAEPGAEAAEPRSSSVLERLPAPVKGASEKLQALVPALRRARREDDAVPARFITHDDRRFAIQPDAARRLRPIGANPLGHVWVVPGGTMRDMPPNDRVRGSYCLVGAEPIHRCESVFDQSWLKRVEVAVCAPGLPHGKHLVWALVPRGATHATVTLADGTSSTEPVRDLLALVRPATAPRVTAVVWTGPKLNVRHATRYPPQTATARCAGPEGPEGTFIELKESTDASSLHAWFDR